MVCLYSLGAKNFIKDNMNAIKLENKEKRNTETLLKKKKKVTLSCFDI